MERSINVSLQCFVRKDGKYLMLHRNKDKKIMPDVWMAPGGKREHTEGLFACAKREIMEETGLEITNITIKVTGAVFMEDNGQEYFPHFLVADYEGGEIIDSPDGELKWLTVDEIAHLDDVLCELKPLVPYIFNESEKVTSFKAVYEKGNEMSFFAIENP